MKGLNDLIGKRVALVDRNFIVVEGRVVYPTTTGILVGATDKILFVQTSEKDDVPAMLFFMDALRCIQDVTSMPQSASSAPSAPSAVSGEP